MEYSFIIIVIKNNKSYMDEIYLNINIKQLTTDIINYFYSIY